MAGMCLVSAARSLKSGIGRVVHSLAGLIGQARGFLNSGLLLFVKLPAEPQDSPLQLSSIRTALESWLAVEVLARKTLKNLPRV